MAGCWIERTLKLAELICKQRRLVEIERIKVAAQTSAQPLRISANCIHLGSLEISGASSSVRSGFALNLAIKVEPKKLSWKCGDQTASLSPNRTLLRRIIRTNPTTAAFPLFTNCVQALARLFRLSEHY